MIKFLCIDHFTFNGAPASFDDENGDIVVITHTIRGHTCRTVSHVVPINLGDTIITKPFFKVVSAANWKKIEEDPHGSD